MRNILDRETATPTEADLARGPWIAALPMYDFPELADAHARLWSVLRGHLVRAGVLDAPAALTRGSHHEATWVHPRLLLGQACEYPLATRFAHKVRLVATPRYIAHGCDGATYRSAVLVRDSDAARTLADLRARRCIINEPSSNSGMNLLRASIAPIASGARFFGAVAVSGSHRRSIEAVATGEADVCAVDCVSLAHLQRVDPSGGASSLRVLQWTPATPSLPLITAAANSDDTLARLRSALRAMDTDPASKEVLDPLLLKGFELSPDAGFAAALDLEREAARLGYPHLV